ncbi:Transcription-repair-coupling factor [Porphyridium purpureum]|uniref:Transcription-repair-coupling factor n=1 Tax=Porphyridium purpureum TaxID=35688 RepID=A0A5J4Z7E2_PORPP|nr:Transcription-repair-coupling factor [Porphyridium purpureum]|eukprot:POR8155..scf295_1
MAGYTAWAGVTARSRRCKRSSARSHCTMKVVAQENHEEGLQVSKVTRVLVQPQTSMPQGTRTDSLSRHTARPPPSSRVSIKPQQLVIHPEYGIGRFIGMEVDPQTGEKRAAIEYADGFLTLTRAECSVLLPHRVNLERTNTRSRKGVAEPALASLYSTTRWDASVRKAKRAVRQLAVNLAQLYATRSKKQREAYARNPPGFQEMVDKFQYAPTPDQLSCIADIYKDLTQRSVPMDRLICGDVGFGKTEVAVRAAGLVALNGRQVLVLCPTTVLATQHFRTFSERLGAVGIQVSVLTRHSSARERRAVLQDIESGALQVLIGTHALLSEKLLSLVSQLGLLIVDEEQRFGVNAKEKIKERCSDVDVLTLSATPIPRTLYMGMSGIREMSMLRSPLPGRKPVRVVVERDSDSILEAAVRSQMARCGQVYVVAPLIRHLTSLMSRLERLVPEARVLVAHGKVSDLEERMVAFLNQKYDVLLCTPIIESGIDVPTTNTIIVYRPDKFGLASLYQLRGRVGRSAEEAHAYLLHEGPFSELTLEAQARLTALTTFEELGSGYELAMHDLQMRGAGVLYGVEQSGAVDHVGFEMYMLLLHQTFQEMQHVQHVPEVAPELLIRPESMYSNLAYRFPLPGMSRDDLMKDGWLPDGWRFAEKVQSLSELEAAFETWRNNESQSAGGILIDLEDEMDLTHLRNEYLRSMPSSELLGLYFVHCELLLYMRSLGISKIRPSATHPNVEILSSCSEIFWQTLCSVAHQPRKNEIIPDKEASDAATFFKAQCRIVSKQGILVKRIGARPWQVQLVELKKLLRPLYLARSHLLNLR